METHGVDWGSRETNGCGTFNGVTDKALREIARMGFTHIWLTGVLRHATQTSHPGLAAQPKSIVKGLAGSPYAVVDYFDVDPDLASSPEKRMDEFKALVKRCRTVGLLKSKSRSRPSLPNSRPVAALYTFQISSEQ